MPDDARIMETVFWFGPQSRRNLGGAVGLTRARLTPILDRLFDEGLLDDCEPMQSSGGRRATAVGLNPGYGRIIGIDLAPDGAMIMGTDFALKPFAIRSCALDVKDGPSTVMAVLSREVDRLLSDHGIEPATVVGLGIGLPGPVERPSGLLIGAPAMASWEGFSIRDHFAQRFKARMFVDNDANMQSLAELWNLRTKLPVADCQENLVVVKMGPAGIGGGIITDGRLLRGAHGGAGELGHVPTNPDGPPCTCGNRGCLETTAASPALLRAATEAAIAGTSPNLAAVLSRNGELALDDLVRAIREGDSVAGAIIVEAGNQIGQVLAGVVNAINPEKIIIGGRLAETGPLMLASIRQSIYARSMPIATRRLDINYSDLGPETSAFGAVLLATSGLFGQVLSR